jgi:hypothetical protein
MSDTAKNIDSDIVASFLQKVACEAFNGTQKCSPVNETLCHRATPALSGAL